MCVCVPGLNNHPPPPPIQDLVARLEAGLPEFPAVLEERRQRVETLTYAVEGLQSHVAEATAQRADAGRLLEEGLREVRSALARRAAEKKKTRSEGEGGDTAEACDVLYRVNPVVTATGGITTMEDMDTEESDALRELFQADLDCVLSAMVQESLPHEEAVSPGECVLGEPTDQEVFQVSEGMPLDWMRYASTRCHNHPPSPLPSPLYPPALRVLPFGGLRRLYGPPPPTPPPPHTHALNTKQTQGGEKARPAPGGGRTSWRRRPRPVRPQARPTAAEAALQARQGEGARQAPCDVDR